MAKIRLKEGEYFNKQLGYVMVYDRRRRECIPKHRYIAEQRLGRTLHSDEYVHHLDHNKNHNAPSNLKVISRHNHNAMRHKKESNFYGRNNPSKHIGPARKAQMRRAWLRRKRVYGDTGAKNPTRLRVLGRLNGQNK
jgi:hypothetical protein